MRMLAVRLRLAFVLVVVTLAGYALGCVQRTNLELLRTWWSSEPMPAACPFLRRELVDPTALGQKRCWAPGRNGIVLCGVKTGSALARFGLQNGDVVTRINGLPMTNPDDGIAAYRALRTTERLSVEVARRGRRTTLDCTLD